MGDKTKIEWTHGPNGEKGATWNPIVGCSPVGAGCKNCYAARMATRLAANPQTPQYLGLAKGGRWTGMVRFVRRALDQPLRWKKPRRIFVCSMGDLFHESVSDLDRLAVFEIMRQSHVGYSGETYEANHGKWRRRFGFVAQHTFLLLTKRPANALRFYRLLRFDPSDGGRGLHLSRDVAFTRGMLLYGDEAAISVIAKDVARKLRMALKDISGGP